MSVKSGISTPQFWTNASYRRLLLILNIRIFDDAVYILHWHPNLSSQLFDIFFSLIHLDVIYFVTSLIYNVLSKILNNNNNNDDNNNNNKNKNKNKTITIIIIELACLSLCYSSCLDTRLPLWRVATCWYKFAQVRIHPCSTTDSL